MSPVFFRGSSRDGSWFQQPQQHQSEHVRDCPALKQAPVHSTGTCSSQVFRAFELLGRKQKLFFRRFLAGIMAIFDEVPEDPEDYVEKNSATHSINVFSMVRFIRCAKYVSKYDCRQICSSPTASAITPSSLHGECWRRSSTNNTPCFRV